MPVSIRQIHPVFVGEVSGVDISQAADAAGRGGHRGRHGQVRRARVPRPEAHRRAADGVHPQLRRHRGRARRQRHQAAGQAPGHRHERRLQPRQGRQAAGPRQPPAPVQPRQHALAFGQLVPGHSGQVFAAVGARREQEGRQHRVRRHAGGLRRARRRHQARDRGPGVRAFAHVLARLARLPRLHRRGEGDVQAGAPAPGAHATR